MFSLLQQTAPTAVETTTTTAPAAAGTTVTTVTVPVEGAAATPGAAPAMPMQARPAPRYLPSSA